MANVNPFSVCSDCTSEAYCRATGKCSIYGVLLTEETAPHDQFLVVGEEAFSHKIFGSSTIYAEAVEIARQVGELCPCADCGGKVWGDPHQYGAWAQVQATSVARTY